MEDLIPAGAADNQGILSADYAQPLWNAGVNSFIAGRAALDRDACLMLRVRDGDDASFALLVEHHRGQLTNYVFRMVQNQALAEELTQDVFLRVYRSRYTYEPSAKFSTWLFRIATHLALNTIRDAKKLKLHRSLDEVAGGNAWEIADQRRTVEQDLLYRSRVWQVRMAIESLPAKQRSAVLMHKYQEMEYAQIAGVLNCSQAAVKSLLFRAYESLRAKLACMV